MEVFVGEEKTQRNIMLTPNIWMPITETGPSHCSAPGGTIYIVVYVNCSTRSCTVHVYTTRALLLHVGKGLLFHIAEAPEIVFQLSFNKNLETSWMDSKQKLEGHMSWRYNR